MVTVVTNGTDVSSSNVSEYQDLRKTHNIPSEAKILVALGSLCKRKNQTQLVEAMPYVLENKKETYLFLCGVDQTNGEIQNQIEVLGLQHNIYLLGYVPYEKVKDIYRQADVNVLASIDEGFGLSMIEAFAQGIPTVTFSDLDAVPDIYSDEAVLLCNNRSTSELANTILKAMSVSWNSEEIKKHSEKFSLENMATDYIKVYEKARELN